MTFLRGSSWMVVVAGLAVTPPFAQTPAPEPQAAGNTVDTATNQSRLQGTAQIDRRNRVVGAVVLVQNEQDPSRVYLTSTDEDGKFRLEGLGDGTYRVALNRSGFEPIVKDGVEVRYPFRAVVEVTMYPDDNDDSDDFGFGETSADSTAISVLGEIHDADGHPVKEARVRLVHPSGDRNPKSVRSDGAGAFEMDVPSGPWRFEVAAVGYLPLRTGLNLDRSTQFAMTLISQPPEYEPSPVELMPAERLIPPEGLLE